MCWKNEWAMAINNLNWAVIHVGRALVKLEKRRDRNRRTVAKINDRYTVSVVMETLSKHETAIARCKALAQTLKDSQTELDFLIKTYGISRGNNKYSKSTARMAEGKRKRKGKKWRGLTSGVK